MSHVSSGSTDGGSFISYDNTTAENHFHGGSKSSASSTSTAQTQPPLAAPKKRRNLPGTPHPNAEVVALSPETLMATNRFVCEICNKGFQRDQNLQLHRRGHNLPWKLKQRTAGAGEIRIRRVYVCPEPSCVHHNPARALGDLTGIKKHFSRKHGEKKWKCEKCSKKYAVQSDLKAHSKTCGSKDYICDCATIFSRRDSFITHRAFCDALTEENNKLRQGLIASTMASTLQSQQPQLLSQSAAPSPLPPFSHPKTPSTTPHDLMPIPPKPINLSAGAMFSPPNLGGGLMSATALLQKAAQMGAAVSSSASYSGNFVNSPLIQNGFITTMAPCSFGGMIPQTIPGLHTTCLKKCPRESSSSQLSFHGGDVSLEMIHDIPMLNGIFDRPQMDATRKKAEGENGDDTMTLDLLGTEGGRGRSLQEQEEMGFGGFMENVSYFRQEAAMGRQTWEI